MTANNVMIVNANLGGQVQTLVILGDKHPQHVDTTQHDTDTTQTPYRRHAHPKHTDTDSRTHTTRNMTYSHNRHMHTVANTNTHKEETICT